MRSQGEVQRPLGLLYLKIHNETNFKKRCSGWWLYVYVAECTEHVGASSKETVGVKQVVSDYCALVHSSDHCERWRVCDMGA